MKKYFHPLTVILKSEYVLMAGESIDSIHTDVGNGVQLDNNGFFDETEDTNPPKDNSVWDDAQ